jgi:spoIIIJ-associated protein
MDKGNLIKSETEELLRKMSLSVDEVSVKEDDGVYFVQIKSSVDAPFLIGRYGETLQAIQRIMEVILFKIFGENIELIMNVNDYRERQKERLEKIAQNVAQRVIAEKKEQSLPYFSNYERKIIHEFITKNHPELNSYSVGEGHDRVLIIVLKND